jgi:hypothetical protein
MRSGAAALLAVLTLASAACYESPEPLARPGERIDRAVLGDWDCTPVDQPAEPPILFRIARFDDTQYYVETVEGADSVDRYQVFPSRVGGRTLLNVRDLAQKTPEDRWVFMRYVLEGRDKMSLWIVPEEAMKGVDEGQAMAVIRRRAADDAIYKRIASCGRRAPR